MSGKPLAEAAKEAGLTTHVGRRRSTRRARIRAARRSRCPTRAELLRAAFASDVGLDEAPIATKDGGFVWFAVTKVEPSHDRTFEEAQAAGRGAVAGRAGRQGACRQGGRSRQAIARRRERRRRRQKRRRAESKTVADIHRDEQGEPARSRWSPRSSASRPTASAPPRRPTGGRCSRSPRTRRRRSTSLDPRVKAMAQQLDERDPREPDRSVCRGAAPLARRDRQPGRPAIRRGRLTPMTHDPRLRSLRTRLSARARRRSR